MKVLVSGGTGLVGRYVVDGLLHAGHEVVVGGRIKRDPSQPTGAEPHVSSRPYGPPQGGGLNPADPPELNRGRRSPLILSPLVGGSKSGVRPVAQPRQAGRPEGDFLNAPSLTHLPLDPTLDQREKFAGIDTFIHLAFDHLPGRYRGGEGDDPARFRHLNHDGSVKLFEDAKAAGVKRCIFLSSRAVYDGQPAGSVLKEDMKLSPDSLYGQIKLETEQALAKLSSSSFITTSLRATGVYGYHRPNKWDGMFEDYLAGKQIAARAGSEVHGDDLAAAILLLLGEEAGAVSGKSFNISDIVTDTHEILSWFAMASGSTAPLPGPADRSAVNVMDTSRLQELGWRPGGSELLHSTLRQLAQTASS